MSTILMIIVPADLTDKADVVIRFKKFSVAFWVIICDARARSVDVYDLPFEMLKSYCKFGYRSERLFRLSEVGRMSALR